MSNTDEARAVYSRALAQHFVSTGLTAENAAKVVTDIGARLDLAGTPETGIHPVVLDEFGNRTDRSVQTLIEAHRLRNPALWPTVPEPEAEPASKPATVRGMQAAARDAYLASAGNPWLTGNLTAQMTMLKADPARAERLRKEAGR